MSTRKTCKTCGIGFDAKYNRIEYCSDKCRYGEGVCRVCDRKFIRRSHTTGEYCSSKCWYNSGDFSSKEYKVCSKCLMEKEIAEFALSGGEGKPHSICRECLSEQFKGKQDKRRAYALQYVFSDFPKKFREARIRMEMTQEQIAKQFGVGAWQVRMWESGKSLPKTSRTREIFEFFGWEIPSAIKEGEDHRIPLGTEKCQNTKCRKDFPIYRLGRKYCSKKCQMDSQWGKDNPAWNGGKMQVSGGYIKVLRPDHPNANSRGYVLEHQLVMSEVIGRPIDKGEHVHHKNGVRSDNRPENLELWTIGHKDPRGVRVTDKFIDMLLSHPQIVALGEAAIATIREVASSLTNKPN